MSRMSLTALTRCCCDRCAGRNFVSCSVLRCMSHRDPMIAGHTRKEILCANVHTLARSSGNPAQPKRVSAAV